jgi:hypothetical protein
MIMTTRSHETLATVSSSDQKLRSKSWVGDLMDERCQQEHLSSIPWSTPTPDADDTVAKAIERMVAYSRRASLPSGETPTTPIARRDANGSLPTSAPPTTPMSGVRPKPPRGKKAASSGTLFYAQVVERREEEERTTASRQ